MNIIIIILMNIIIIILMNIIIIIILMNIIIIILMNIIIIILMIQKCQIQEVGHYRTEQQIKLTGAHVFRCKQRKFKYIF